MTICYGGQVAGGCAGAAGAEADRAHQLDDQRDERRALVSSYLGVGFPITNGSVPDATHLARKWAWVGSQLWRENATGNLFRSQIGYLAPNAYNVATTYAAGDIVWDNVGLGSLWTSLVGANTGNPLGAGSAFWIEGVVAYPGKPIKITVTPGVKAGYTYVGIEHLPRDRRRRHRPARDRAVRPRPDARQGRNDLGRRGGQHSRLLAAAAAADGPIREPGGRLSRLRRVLRGPPHLRPAGVASAAVAGLAHRPVQQFRRRPLRQGRRRDPVRYRLPAARRDPRPRVAAHAARVYADRANTRSRASRARP
jgi:hypothetical protein